MKISEDETLDALLQGRVVVIQSRRGYRFSLDALLLAHFVKIEGQERVVDLGTGNGILPLILAFLYPSVRVVGLEIQETMVERALKSVNRNQLQKRIEILHGDVCSVPEIFSPGIFDVVICNPPYRRVASGRINPHAEKRVARHEIRAALRDFLQAGFYLLGGRGKMTLIYPAERAIDLLQTMREENLEPKRMRWVHSFPASEATLVLVEGVKRARSEVTIAPPLVVYEKSGIYSEEVKKILEG